MYVHGKLSDDLILIIFNSHTKMNGDTIHNVVQSVCFLTGFTLTVSFVIRYYLAVLHQQDKTSPLMQALHAKCGLLTRNSNTDHYELNINNISLISSCKVIKINNAKEVSSLNLSIISVIFSYVALLFFIVDKFLDSSIYNGSIHTTIITTYQMGLLSDIAFAIAFASQPIFGYSICGHLTSILHNSIYQLSKKWIQLMQMTNSTVLVVFLINLTIIRGTGTGRQTTIGIILAGLLVLGQLTFIATVMRLYYIKLGQIINDLHNSKFNSNVHVKRATRKAEQQILNRIVQSWIVNALFFVLLLCEIVSLIFISRFINGIETQLKFRNSIMCCGMNYMIGISSLQAGFNIELYQKWCNKCHNCCVVVMKWCLYTKK